eukprot:GILI01014294.1.p1 GENE.GILI01014294.1~~GILI01014294.1.p1  ORF type:complete len:226 (-),score=20.98 GILI01014294.1:250-927(-)
MKRRLLVVPEKESQCHPSLRYTVVAPPKYFVRTDILTVFPELREVVDNARTPTVTSPTTEYAAATQCAAAGPSGLPLSSAAGEVTSLPTSPNSVAVPEVSPFVITTFQVSEYESLIGFSGVAQEFKDHSRDRFIGFMNEVQRRLVPEGWWVDYADPATGLPVLTRGSSAVYCESDAIEQLLSMELMHVNGCRMVIHPIFGEQVYPASAVVYGGTSDRLKELLIGL